MFQRRAEEVTLLIREAFLRGISTRQTGRVVATLTGGKVSAQTVSRITQVFDQVVREFHRARLSDEYGYLFLDGVSLRMWRPTGLKPVHMLVRWQCEGQAEWEGRCRICTGAGWRRKTCC